MQGEIYMNEHRYDMSQLEKEEATMEAEDVAQAKFDELKADYIREMLTGFITFFGGTEHEYDDSCFSYDVWPDWHDTVSNNTIELVRLNLACGDREKAGMVLVESLEEYMDEIAARAVRERNNE